ncbi:ABC-type dipeptide/oligopeptide/nickel transport system, permease component [Synechococcus sp. PCC 7502]|uniref:ABC transporter permease n=1 Tax=Synechococcus sp. PCC 7502 TaxID=1173263 RepID=UPI00029FAA29|nr:ABC transporter permease [Synechococcus sp. PCC 7502]AFY74680.1 ABC-type dipeptide/oligopeptide/nickel transport system, permease component [Synechococcus sp. PCC 7502]
MNWWKRLSINPLARIGAIFIGILYGLTIFAGFITPYSMYDAPKNSALLPPTQIYWHNQQGEYIGAHVYPTTQGAVDFETGDRKLIVDFSKPSRILIFHYGHLFSTTGEGRLNLLGTDDQGRDQFTRLLYGGRVSLFIGIIGTSISFAVGCLVGGISGYFGGLLDSFLMRLVEVIMSVPSIYLLVALAAILDKNPFTQLPFTNAERFILITVIISFVQWAGLARIIRNQVLSIKEEQFVTAAIATGADSLRIITRHILPQTSSFIVISATLAIPSFIVSESVLSLIGLGIQPPDPSWGNMLSLATNASVIILQPWLIWSPAVLIILTVLSFNLLGDGLRDALDPKNLKG